MDDVNKKDNSESKGTMSEQHITLENSNRCGLITLDRPEALNALSLDMINPIKPNYKKWAKDPHIYGVVMQSAHDRAFCAGADVRYILWALEHDKSLIQQYFKAEYETDWAVCSFFKPTVPLINGYVMGGGIGLSVYGTHFIMAEKAVFAMPEINLGLFPDVGMSYLLSRLPNHLGTYLALTGHSLSPSECYALEIASHTVRSSDFPKIRNAMHEADPIDTILDELHQDFGLPAIDQHIPFIKRAFDTDSIEGIFAKLQEEGEASNSSHKEWATSILKELQKKSPLSLKITLRLLQKAKTFQNLKEALNLDYNLMCHFIESSDFKEGIKSTLIDKSYSPTWQHKSIEDVSDHLIDGYFTFSSPKALDFIDYNIRT
ncbi:MAG: enoyl-CoA hydratase/isomerase family protein [Pseudomonadota bacterium]